MDLKEGSITHSTPPHFIQFLEKFDNDDDMKRDTKKLIKMKVKKKESAVFWVRARTTNLCTYSHLCDFCYGIMPGNGVELFQMAEDTWYPYIASAGDEMQTNPVDNEPSIHIAIWAAKRWLIFQWQLFSISSILLLYANFVLTFLTHLLFKMLPKRTSHSLLFIIFKSFVFFFSSPILKILTYCFESCLHMQRMRRLTVEREEEKFGTLCFRFTFHKSEERKKNTHSCDKNTIRWNELNERTMLFS